MRLILRGLGRCTLGHTPNRRWDVDLPIIPVAIAAANPAQHGDTMVFRSANVYPVQGLFRGHVERVAPLFRCANGRAIVEISDGNGEFGVVCLWILLCFES